jgi:hypothetical protein
VPLTVQEFHVGVTYWRTTPWPPDFHNNFYGRMAESNPNGNFDKLWWHVFLKELKSWRATRGKGKTDEYLTARAQARFAALGRAWSTGCVPSLNNDISDVRWDQVAAFPETVAQIKDVRSPVFTSKFCHFLLPQIFPVVDNRAMGNRFPTYESYFKFVQTEWSSTSEVTRALLGAILDGLIGAGKISMYPTTNKLVELCLIGRHQAGPRSWPR